MLDETVPAHLLGTFGTYTNVYANLGLLIVMGLGLGLPSDPTKYKDDEFWRVIYGFPIITLGTGVYLLLTIFKQDSIGFSVMKEDKEAAIEMISHIYGGNNEDHIKIYDDIKKNTKVESSGTTFK